jgi:hypothetical protein
LAGALNVAIACILGAELLPAFLKLLAVAITLNHRRRQEGLFTTSDQNPLSELKPVSEVLPDLLFRCHSFSVMMRNN